MINNTVIIPKLILLCLEYLYDIFIFKLIWLRYNLHTTKCNHFKATFWCVLTHVCSFLNTTSISMNNISVIPQSSLMVLCSQSPHETHPKSPLVLLLTSLEFHDNGLIEYILFYLRFLSLSRVPSRLIYVVVCIGNLFLLLLSSVLLNGYATIYLCIHLWCALWLFLIQGCYQQICTSEYKSLGEHVFLSLCVNTKE